MRRCATQILAALFAVDGVRALHAGHGEAVTVRVVRPRDEHAREEEVAVERRGNRVAPPDLEFDAAEVS